jgi:tetratricopeptide (TPR) repeat protein
LAYPICHAHRTKGEALMARGDYARAEQCYRRTLQVAEELKECLRDAEKSWRPTGDWYLGPIVQCLMRQGKFKEALEMEERMLLELDNLSINQSKRVVLGDRLKSQTRIGNLLLGCGRLADAERVFADVVAKTIEGQNQTPSAATSRLLQSVRYRLLATAQALQGKTDEALRHYEQALELIRLHVTSGSANAEEFTSLKCALASHLSVIYTAMGYTLLEARRAEEARHAFEQAQRHWKYVGLHGGMSLSSEAAWRMATCPIPELRDLDEAELRVDELVGPARRDPSSVSSRDYCRCLLVLAVVRHQRGMHAEAVKFLRASLAREGERGLMGSPEQKCAALVFLAMAYAALGEPTKAREHYAQAVALIDRIAPYDFEMRHLRAKAAELLGVGTQK